MVLWMLETIAIFSNYLSIRDDLPFYDSKYLIVRLTSTIVFWIIILFLTLLLVVLHILDNLCMKKLIIW